MPGAGAGLEREGSEVGEVMGTDQAEARDAGKSPEGEGVPNVSWFRSEAKRRLRTFD